MTTRRDVLTLVGGTAVAWPVMAQAQQVMPVIGFLHNGSPEPSAGPVAAFRKGLSDTGFIEGQHRRCFRTLGRRRRV